MNSNFWVSKFFKRTEVKIVKKSALGIIGNKVSTIENIGFDDVLEFRNKNRKKIYDTSFKIKSLLTGELASEFKGLKNCGEAIIAPNKQALLLYNTDHQVAHYGGLATCSSVWACPFCATKIQIRRRGEVAELVEKVYEAGYKVSMITFTHPHQRDFSLKENIEIFNSALRKLKQQRWYRQNIKDNADLGYIGDITCREVTWGSANGWHWHAHRLVIVKNPKILIKYKENLQKLWVHCYELACRENLRKITEENKRYMTERGLDILEKAQSTDYLVKIGGNWGAEKEMVGVMTKKGKVGRYTPFDLVGVRDDKFVEYIRATKGKRQLLYSKGLRALFGLTEEKTDEELIQEQVEHSVKVANISYKNWQKILRENLKLEICEILERDFGDISNLKIWAEKKKINISFLGFDSGG